MRLKILIAPDKFKGTLSAREAADAIAGGWRAARPEDELNLLPISDGGDGFGQVMGELLQARTQHTRTVDAAHRDCLAPWWWEPKSKTAIIESAKVIGLAMLPPGKFHPFQLDTFGLGAVIRAASTKGARRCIIGIGGSATNDGGFGLARALGWKFIRRDETEIEHWTDLPALAKIRAPKRTRWFEEFIIAVDVQNPLLGPRGATRVYGPQKGLQAKDFTGAESNLRRLARIAERTPGRNFARISGAGAAGGLGFGLMTFNGARSEPGFDLFARLANLKTQLRTSDLVITGEGRVDKSSLMGKGVGELARLAQARNIPCLAFAGEIADRAQIKKTFNQAYSLTDLTSAKNAKAKAEQWLQRLAEQAAREVIYR